MARKGEITLNRDDEDAADNQKLTAFLTEKKPGDAKFCFAKSLKINYATMF